jgi:hypothetical protein
MDGKSRSALWVATIVLSGAANAIEPIPGQPGWSGFVTLSLGAHSTETNLVAGIDAFGVDVGNETISSLSAKPDSKWGQATFVYYQQSSNINFYDASSMVFSLGAQYRF